MIILKSFLLVSAEIIARSININLSDHQEKGGYRMFKNKFSGIFSFSMFSMS